VEILGTVLLVGGGIFCLAGGVWLLIAAFRQNPLWGFGCMFIPFVALAFLIVHWDKAGKPFLIQLGGAALIFAGSYLGGKLG
jgi:hypothetical protein